MNAQSDVTTLKKKIQDASHEIRGSSIEKTRRVLEDLSDNMRSSMAKTEIECYDTLLELDYLCDEANLHINLDYSSALKELMHLYENETT
jgi:ribosomal protein L22